MSRLYVGLHFALEKKKNCSQPGKKIAGDVGWEPTWIVRECYFQLLGSAENSCMYCDRME